MITDENNDALNDNDQVEEQKSQQDTQSDGIDNIPASEEDQIASDLDHLNQADESSEPSFTLDVEKGIAPGNPERD